MGNSRNVSLRTVWGLAKSAELHLTDEELHMIVCAQTGKDSLKLLNKGEISGMVCYLRHLKDSVRRTDRKQGHPSNRGNPSTANQRKKIAGLCRELGWEEPKRLNGFCRRMFRVDSIDWLNYSQCSTLIEALKKMAARQADTEGKGRYHGQQEV